MKLSHYLKQLKESHKTPIYLLGHLNTDVDSLVSVWLLSRLMNEFGIANHPTILDSTIPSDTLELVSHLPIPIESFNRSLPKNASVFLVDHFETIQSIADETIRSSVEILGCVDHHPTNKQMDYPFYQYESIGCCARLIFDELSPYLTGEELAIYRQATLVALMVDTCSLRSSKATPSDKAWVAKLEQLHPTEVEQATTLGFCLTNLTQPMEQLFLNGAKRYKNNTAHFGCSYIQVFRQPNETIQSLLTYGSCFLKNHPEDFWIFLVVDFKNDETIEYQIFENQTLQTIHKGIKSRGVDIIPKYQK